MGPLDPKSPLWKSGAAIITLEPITAAPDFHGATDGTIVASATFLVEPSQTARPPKLSVKPQFNCRPDA